ACRNGIKTRKVHVDGKRPDGREQPKCDEDEKPMPLCNCHEGGKSNVLVLFFCTPIVKNATYQLPLGRKVQPSRFRHQFFRAAVASFCGRAIKYTPSATNGRLSNWPMLNFIPSSNASWFSLRNSSANRAPKRSIKNTPNRKPGFKCGLW